MGDVENDVEVTEESGVGCSRQVAESGGFEKVEEKAEDSEKLEYEDYVSIYECRHTK